MKILVFSDTHGDFRLINNAVMRHKNAEVIIHCGDGEEQANTIKKSYPDKMVISVKGNCDWCSNLNATEKISLNGKKIFITHGHLYNVKSGLYNICCAAREENADIVLFGHTHNPVAEYDNGLYILNPGSCHGYNATYGCIDVSEAGIITNIMKAE